MKKGILGRKVGMTQVFANNGKLIPVTVISVEPNVISQIKTIETDGYEAIQLAFETKREKLSNKPELGHLKKSNTSPKRFLREIRNVDTSSYTLGQEIKVDIFAEGEMVDVTGTSKGKGYQGVIKRYNQSRGPMGHGSQYHRGVGSLGTMRPMRVLKGKKLPGHMGANTVTVQNLEVVMVDLENNVILVKGNVPGPKKSLVIIKSAVKNEGTINETLELVSYEEPKAIEEVVTENNSEVIEESSNDEVNITEEASETTETEEVKEESSQETVE